MTVVNVIHGFLVILDIWLKMELLPQSWSNFRSWVYLCLIRIMVIGKTHVKHKIYTYYSTAIRNIPTFMVRLTRS